MQTIIPRNTTFPTTGSKICRIAVDNHANVVIRILQGENYKSCDNDSVGRAIANGATIAPNSVAQIDVSFDIDWRGVLRIKAKDQACGKKLNINNNCFYG